MPTHFCVQAARQYKLQYQQSISSGEYDGENRGNGGIYGSGGSDADGDGDDDISSAQGLSSFLAKASERPPHSVQERPEDSSSNNISNSNSNSNRPSASSLESNQQSSAPSFKFAQALANQALAEIKRTSSSALQQYQQHQGQGQEAVKAGCEEGDDDDSDPESLFAWLVASGFEQFHDALTSDAVGLETLDDLR
jgi:hypothetical protein